MFVYCVNVYVKEEFLDDFIKMTVENHEGTRAEAGNIRFDFLQCKDTPTKFFLYEVYESEDAVLAHKETEHYKKWKNTVADWMAKPREGTKYDVIAPSEKEKW